MKYRVGSTGVSQLRFVSLLVMCLVQFGMVGGQSKSASAVAGAVHAPSYTSDGRLLPQPDYREWIYLTSGLDMSYTAGGPSTGGHSTFDNVFVNPEAYRSYLQAGTWPDKTMLIIEVRGAESNASINKSGHFQSENLMGFEVHVKDAARGGWAFYQSDGASPAKMLPKDADCYSCHRDHAAVDTTFVQFYPTLMPLAKQKGTLSAEYLKDETKSNK